ncbi:hypothetical protein [Niallia taxi]|uniref:hypothetical protein n=1 Tax=Niallia taxi TaxID=2499688 RepID=UPI003008758D
MNFEMTLVKLDGTKETIMKGKITDTAFNSHEDFRLPRTFTVQKTPYDNQFYPKLLTKVGEKVIVEADNVRTGLFNVLLGEEEIILKEVLINL